MKTYSVISFHADSQNVEHEKLSLQEAQGSAITISKGSPLGLTAVVDEETDEALVEEVYNNGKKMPRSLVHSIVYGLSRFM